MREKYQQGDAITWLQVHNLLPVLGAIVAALSVYYVLQNKVELQNQQLGYLGNNVSSCLDRLASFETRINAQSLDIKELQTKGTVRGASTQFSQPNPPPTPEQP